MSSVNVAVSLFHSQTMHQTRKKIVLWFRSSFPRWRLLLGLIHFGLVVLRRNWTVREMWVSVCFSFCLDCLHFSAIIIAPLYAQGLEKYVMTKLFTRVFASNTEDVIADEKLFQKMSLVQQFISPENLDIQPTFQNESSWLVSRSSQKLACNSVPSFC